MENLTWQIGLTVDAGAFSWPGSLCCCVLLCVKAAESRRHREDSSAGGRSHAVPPSRSPKTGSLIDSSNTPHILLPFIKASPLPPAPQKGAEGEKRENVPPLN